MRGRNLQLAGIELVLPTVLCIESRTGKGERTTLTIGYASRYADTIVGPLAAEWLSRQFHCRFAEHGRGAEGDLAAEAFYDKLACEFTGETAFLAAIISPHQPPGSAHPGHGGHGANIATHAAAARRHDTHRGINGDILSRFMAGPGLVRWTFEGRVRAFLNTKTAAAQVTIDPLPGGIELTGMAKTDASGARLGKRGHEAIAWCGFGVPICDPAELVLTLRNEIAEFRHPAAHATRAAHV
jgi:hypothetical protein